MLANVKSCAVVGLDGVVVDVEVDVRSGLPAVAIVGLPDDAVQESRERVQSAIKNAGLPYSRNRIIVNLAPPSIRKEGPLYDLPIAVGILVTTEAITPESLEGALFAGELSLDGSLRNISGALQIADLARREGFSRLYVPEIDAPEAALIPGLEVFPVASLADLHPT